MRIMNNISAMNAHRLYTANNSKLSKSLEKLSSGYAINRAGDNAAGLAVSEKMRAQIAGLEQASKNAQDGISMVQTYEGALTESDSILQRMRSLAVQSANGTYDNSVDRVAIEQEFKQLNDELNQIADTDFNGVVVLNGGQMADGLKAIDGTFDYSTAERDAMQLSAKMVNELDYQKFDDADTSKGVTKADKIWNTISDGTWDRSTVSGDHGPESVDVTLKFNAKDGNWTVDSATNGANKAKFSVTQTDNGGLVLKAGTDDISTVVIDETTLKNGDTLTLTLNNPYAGIAAPTNAGASVVSSNYTEAAGGLKAQDANLVVAIDAGLTDDKMTEDIEKILNAFDGATVEIGYTASKANATENTTATITLADGTPAFTLKGDGTTDNAAATLKDGTEYQISFDGTTITIKDNAATPNTLMTLTAATHAGTDTGSGTFTYNVGVEYKAYDTSKLPTVEIKAPKDNGVSLSNANEASTSKLTYADGMTLQVGSRTKDLVNFTFAYDADSIGELKADLDCSARGLGTDKLSLATQEAANAAIDKIDHAINKISMVRGTFGSIQNRLEHKISNLDTNNENLTAAESRIRDTDMAAEMMEFTKNQILSQASQSMLAQANQLPQGVLSLLQ